MKRHLRNGMALVLGLIAIPGAATQPVFAQPIKNDPGRSNLIARTEAALLDQINCQIATNASASDMTEVIVTSGTRSATIHIPAR